MRSMQTVTRTILCGVVLLGLLAGCSSAGTDTEAAAGATSGAAVGDLLYVQRADGASLRTDSEGTTLTLSGLDPSTTWFTDRPTRRAGTVATSDFIADWTTTFGSDDPNAVVDIADPSAVDVTVKLHPLSSTATSVSYRVMVDAGSQPFPDSIGAVSLFIDGGGSIDGEQQLTFEVAGMMPGQTLSIRLTSVGAAFSSGGWNTPLVAIDAQGGFVPIVGFSVGSEILTLATASQSGGAPIGQFSFAVVVDAPNAAEVTFDGVFDPAIMVSVTSPNGAPQPINNGPNAVLFQ